MKPMEAEKLLGGYATGTLTEAERKRLFEAALDRQDLFDALMDEESLRELLADPAAKVQLLAALASAPTNIVPFWRRPGLVGAAATLLMASLAGLAYLRSPEEKTAAAKQEAPPLSKSIAQMAPRAEPSVAREQAKPTGGGKAAPVPLILNEAKEFAPAEARGRTAKAKAEEPPEAASPVPLQRVQAEPPPAPAAHEVEPAKQAAGVLRSEGSDKRAKTSEAVVSLSASVTADSAFALSPGVTGGPAAIKAPRPAPPWSLETLPDGSTRVTVKATPGIHAVLLRRGASGIEALKAQAPGRWQVRLNPGDALDLYLLNRPVAEPAKLPETGPVDGFRARIHPK